MGEGRIRGGAQRRPGFLPGETECGDGTAVETGGGENEQLGASRCAPPPGHVGSPANGGDAAFERAAYASKSFIIALALCRGRLTAHEAADASHVEVRSQIELWGEVEDCQ